MKEVVVHPERCVGCMQCMVACAVAHSRTLNLYSALFETPKPNPRIHVGAGRYNEGFPNRCRHCDPAPCQSACLAGAIYRLRETGTVMINPDRCINCASCAMACPYGVIRFHEDPLAPTGRTIALKCDNCNARVAKAQVPACVEVCKTKALTYETIGAAMKRKTAAVARSFSAVSDEGSLPAGISLLRSIKQVQTDINGR